MRRADLARLKNQLIQTQARLAAESRNVADNLPEIVQSTGDLTNVPTHNADHDVEGLDVEIVTAKIQDHMRAQVAAALQRIDAGRYGICESCGEEIPIERLNAVPDTPFCIICRDKVEQEGRVGEDWDE